MCFSFEVSLGTGLFSWCIGLFLLSKKLTKQARLKVYFLLIFSSMQFADAILWYNKMRRNNINYYITSLIIPAILSGQIINNVYYYNKVNNRVIDLIVWSFILYIFIKINGYSVKSCNKYGSPLWGNWKINIYEMLFFSLLIFYPHKPSIIVGLFYMFVSYFIFGGISGSGWCAISNIGAFYYLYKYYNAKSII